MQTYKSLMEQEIDLISDFLKRVVNLLTQCKKSNNLINHVFQVFYIANKMNLN